MPRKVEIPPALRDRPFSWEEAQATGLTKHQLQSSAFRHVFREVWVAADLPDDRSSRLAAARLVIPTHGVLQGLTAAWVYGADVRREGDLDVHVGYPPGRRRRGRPGVLVSQETLEPRLTNGSSTAPRSLRRCARRSTACGYCRIRAAWSSRTP